MLDELKKLQNPTPNRKLQNPTPKIQGNFKIQTSIGGAEPELLEA
jgi:hypothetical protein